MRIEGKPELTIAEVAQGYIHLRSFPLVVLDYHLRMCVRRQELAKGNLVSEEG